MFKHVRYKFILLVGFLDLGIHTVFSQSSLMSSYHRISYLFWLWAWGVFWYVLNFWVWLNAENLSSPRPFPFHFPPCPPWCKFDSVQAKMSGFKLTLTVATRIKWQTVTAVSFAFYIACSSAYTRTAPARAKIWTERAKKNGTVVKNVMISVINGQLVTK